MSCGQKRLTKPIIKICGLTRLKDAELSLQLGADLLGFNFYKPSPRYIEPAAAAEIINQLPTETQTVGVFVNMPTHELQTLLNICPLNSLQLHGDETSADCQAANALGPEIIKALRIRKIDDINQCDHYDVKTILLDAFREELYGGTGHAFDWSWIKNKLTNKNFFLAGGITPENITNALTIGTYGIDLCSGTESEPGIKDHQKLKTLFNIIKATSNN